MVSEMVNMKQFCSRAPSMLSYWDIRPCLMQLELLSALLHACVKNKNFEPSNINHIKLSVSHRRLAPPLSLRKISLSCPYGLGKVREMSSTWPTHSFYLMNIDFSESEWGGDFWGRGAQSKMQVHEGSNKFNLPLPWNFRVYAALLGNEEKSQFFEVCIVGIPPKITTVHFPGVVECG